MGDKQHVGRLVGVLVVFLCLHVFTAQQWVVGVGARFGLGIKRFSAAVWWWGAFKHTVGFTFNTV